MDKKCAHEGGFRQLKPTQLLKAIAFATDKHLHQRRKDAEASAQLRIRSAGEERGYRIRPAIPAETRKIATESADPGLVVNVTIAA